VDTLLDQLDKPPKSLKMNLTVMGTALDYLHKHAYHHPDILSACEVLASRVVAMINAASAGGTSEAYEQFAVLMPTSIQSSSAMTTIPLEKFKTLQQHTKLLSRIHTPDNNKNKKRRYDSYGSSYNSNGDYRSQQQNRNRQRQSGGYGNNRYNNNNPSGVRPTHNNNNSGSSSAAAQQ
jgi:hypothetical protein